METGNLGHEWGWERQGNSDDLGGMSGERRCHSTLGRGNEGAGGEEEQGQDELKAKREKQAAECRGSRLSSQHFGG